jgi:hypothetical protein
MSACVGSLVGHPANTLAGLHRARGRTDNSAVFAESVQKLQTINWPTSAGQRLGQRRACRRARDAPPLVLQSLEILELTALCPSSSGPGTARALLSADTLAWLMGQFAGPEARTTIGRSPRRR